MAEPLELRQSPEDRADCGGDGATPDPKTAAADDATYP